MEAVAEKIEVEKHVLAVMDRTGDTKTIWDPAVPAEVEIAREQFAKLKKKGFTIYAAQSDGSKGTVMHEFDPQARKLIAVPAVVGG